MSKRKFIKAILMQYSGIVGAGIFILPYLFFYSNFISLVLVDRYCSFYDGS